MKNNNQTDGTGCVAYAAEAETPPPAGEKQQPNRRNWLRVIRRDERGLSTLEWILLVAAVGGLATAGVIIVRNAVGGAGDQVNDDSRQERLAQAAVNDAIRTLPNGNRQNDNSIEYQHLTGEDPTTHEHRCNLNYKLTDGSYPLRRLRGSFTLRPVNHTSSGTFTINGASQIGANNATWWCDAVPTNNLDNNDVTIAGPVRAHYSGKCKWPDGVEHDC